MSFVAVVLQNTEYWPAAGGVTTYQINNALVLPLAAQSVLGTGGVVAVILMVSKAQSLNRSSILKLYRFSWQSHLHSAPKSLHMHLL